MRKLAELTEGDRVEGCYVCLSRDVRQTKTGVAFVTMKLADTSGQVKLIKFDFDTSQAPEFARHNAVQVRGRVERFGGALQIKADWLEPAQITDVNVEDVIPRTAYDVDQLAGELRTLFKARQNPFVRTLLLSFLDDEEFLQTFKLAPASKTMHHPFRGGLLEHVVSVSKLALKVCEHYSQIDADLLLAGVFFHDIGKVHELRLGPDIEYTDAGMLLGHITIGIGMIDAKAAAIKDFPTDLLMTLKHLVLSHHGRLEFGSPKLPATLEAMVLHYLDNLDAKVWGYCDAVQKLRDNEHWTEYVKMFETRLYHAPAASAAGAKPTRL